MPEINVSIEQFAQAIGVALRGEYADVILETLIQTMQSVTPLIVYTWEKDRIAEEGITETEEIDRMDTVEEKARKEYNITHRALVALNRELREKTGRGCFPYISKKNTEAIRKAAFVLFAYHAQLFEDMEN